LSEAGDDKQQKALFKQFLQEIIGINLGKNTFKKPPSNHHEETLVMQLSKPSWEDGVDNLAIQKLWE